MIWDFEFRQDQLKNHLQSATIELVYLYYEQHRVKRGKANSIVAPCIVSGKPILKIYYLQWFPNFLVLYKYARMFADIRHTHRPEIYIINAMFQKKWKVEFRMPIWCSFFCRLFLFKRLSQNSFKRISGALSFTFDRLKIEIMEVIVSHQSS